MGALGGAQPVTSHVWQHLQIRRIGERHHHHGPETSIRQAHHAQGSRSTGAQNRLDVCDENGDARRRHRIIAASPDTQLAMVEFASIAHGGESVSAPPQRSGLIVGRVAGAQVGRARPDLLIVDADLDSGKCPVRQAIRCPADERELRRPVVRLDAKTVRRRSFHLTGGKRISGDDHRGTAPEHS